MYYLKQILYENNSPSLTRFISVVAFMAFLVVSAFLVLAGKQWVHYDTFASLTAGGGLATQVTNKLINSKYNSPQGEMPNK